MKLGEKIRYLREVEGSLRGLDRAMSQQELVRAIDAETGSKISQSYLSQIESGARPHLTNTTRQILAGFFKVHPGYLVDDPEGYSPELQSELRNVEDKLDLWLERQPNDLLHGRKPCAAGHGRVVRDVAGRGVGSVHPGLDRRRGLTGRVRAPQR